MNRTVLLFATTTGYQIRSFGDAAAKLGVRLVFASDRCDQIDDPWWDQAIPVRFHDEEASLARVTADAPPIDGVIAVGDRPTVLAAMAAEALGVAGNPVAAARASRNKRESHAALKTAGLPVTPYETVAMRDDPRAFAGRMRYPAVIKPLALSGSRGVMRADDPASLVAGFERLRRILDAADVRLERDDVHGLALIEDFIPGREFAVEGILTEGRFRPLAIFDKPDPLDGPFFEETIYVTPSRAAPGEQAAMVDHVARAAAALGLRHGPVHAECRVMPPGAGAPRVYVLEIAARPIGGLCSKALRFTGPDGNGAALEELLLRHALGDDVTGFTREAAASGVMMIPIPGRGVLRRVEGVEAAEAVPHVEEVRITAKRDARLVPLPEGRSYLGFLFARAGAPAAVEQALRDGHAQLYFAIDREILIA